MTDILRKHADPQKKYDLVVIGSGPGGEKAAIQCAKLGKSVLVIEKDHTGGTSLNRGTIPSKTLWESVRYINLIKQRQIYGISVRLDQDLTIDPLMHRKRAAISSLTERLENTFERNDVDLIQGAATLIDPHTVRVSSDSNPEEEFEAAYIVIAVGTRPYRPDFLDFDHPRVRDSDTVLGIREIPKTLTIVGGGVIACEYATIFSNLGVKVNLVDPRPQVLDFLDREFSSALTYLMRDQGIRVRPGETVNHAEWDDKSVVVSTESGKRIKSDFLLFAFGRMGNTQGLGLEEVGIETAKYQLIKVNPFFQTNLPNIYAVGDVIGPPSLAATAMDQGRLAALHAFTDSTERHRYELLPTGIYTIPEISTVGATEEQLTEQMVSYEVGTAGYREIARGQIIGSTTGRIKLLFNRENLKLLGVHIIGNQATELVHIGQTVMAFEGKVDYFIDHVFNYPTFSECYRIAALNGVNKL
ncbi:MAG: Si-specific NAD(P)(+) transhydrogenase [SAR324 cluster bacterium]|nr:Si-specific NAD(P)(+) transhydrogenase [SAR324 cluster bacterium]